MDLPLPIQVIYAGLGGSLLALIVATAQQKWQPRVFFLLALRLAIGWHFLFEGMNKIQSHVVGATETSKPFTSAPYFEVGEGPVAEYMRKTYLDDPEAKLYDLVRPVGNPQTVGDLMGTAFEATLTAEFAKPGAATNLVHAYVSPTLAGANFPESAAKAVVALPLNGAGTRFLADVPVGPLRDIVEAKIVEALPPLAKQRFDATEAAVAAKATAAGFAEKAAKSMTNARLNYARWAVGLDTKDAKKKYVSGEIAQTVPARLTDYDNRKKDYAELMSRKSVDLGRSTLFAKLTATKAELGTVRADLVKDGESFLTDAKADLVKLAGLDPKDAPVEPTPKSKILMLDYLTMGTLTAAGACLIIGFGTRIAALACAGFLILTYLTHPPFPWIANPPGTEGNPVFINKNTIETIALFVIASVPSGSWLGIDGLIARVVFGRRDAAV
jgi:uncharacterized membrane protein YphA (DoxX/SURF4 family)